MGGKIEGIGGCRLRLRGDDSCSVVPRPQVTAPPSSGKSLRRAFLPGTVQFMHFSLDEALAPQALLLHAGYLLLITSMLMTRITWLRVLAVGSGLLEGSYYLVTDDFNSLFWEMMFVLTN